MSFLVFDVVSSCFPAERRRPCCHWPADEFTGQGQWWRAQLPGVLAADWASREQTRGVQPIRVSSDTLVAVPCALPTCPYAIQFEETGKRPNGKHPKVCFKYNVLCFYQQSAFLLTLPSHQQVPNWHRFCHTILLNHFSSIRTSPSRDTDKHSCLCLQVCQGVAEWECIVWKLRMYPGLV